MKMSMGSDLLKMLSKQDATSVDGKKPKDNKVVRNFNFKMNITEIDKIIEEDETTTAAASEVARSPRPASRKIERKQWGNNEKPQNVMKI
jgi:hypothetical protein